VPGRESGLYKPVSRLKEAATGSTGALCISAMLLFGGLPLPNSGFLPEYQLVLRLPQPELVAHQDQRLLNLYPRVA
jgi:hypothetical protein